VVEVRTKLSVIIEFVNKRLPKSTNIMKESNKIYHNEYDKIGPVEELTTLGRQSRAVFAALIGIELGMQ
jgi:hypothetical protein